MSQQGNPDVVREIYLSNAVKRSQEIPRQTYESGGVHDFKFPHAGIGRYALVSFVGTLSRTETATPGTMTASPFWPFNLISRVLLTDYTGTTRVNALPYHLYQRQCKNRYGFDPSVSSPVSPAYAGSVWAVSVPTASASNTTTSDCIFSFKVPISLHEDTTLGSLPFAIPDGETTLQLQMNALTGSTIDFPFILTGATTCSITGTWYVTYHYFDAPNNVPLPIMDFSTIHELVSVRKTQNMVAGSDTLFTLETGRTYYQLIQNLVANNALNTTGVTQIQFLIDGNTPTLDEFLLSYLSRVRETYGRDLNVGEFLFDFFGKPWSPVSYGSLQTNLKLSSGITLGSVYWLDVLKESMYFAKSALQVA